MIIATIIVIASYNFDISENSHDKEGSRDEACEITTKAFLDKVNPWEMHYNNIALTTGPFSILVASPFVYLTGKINILSFIFWILFLSILLYYDIKKRNSFFLFFCIIILSELFCFKHSLYWSLEELYYGWILIAFSIILINKKKSYIPGILLAFSLFVRINYAFALFAIFLYILFSKNIKIDMKFVLKLCLGITYRSNISYFTISNNL